MKSPFLGLQTSLQSAKHCLFNREFKKKENKTPQYLLSKIELDYTTFMSYVFTYL